MTLGRRKNFKTVKRFVDTDLWKDKAKTLNFYSAYKFKTPIWSKSKPYTNEANKQATPLLFTVLALAPDWEPGCRAILFPLKCFTDCLLSIHSPTLLTSLWFQGCIIAMNWSHYLWALNSPIYSSFFHDFNPFRA